MAFETNVQAFPSAIGAPKRAAQAFPRTTRTLVLGKIWKLENFIFAGIQGGDTSAYRIIAIHVFNLCFAILDNIEVSTTCAVFVSESCWLVCQYLSRKKYKNELRESETNSKISRLVATLRNSDACILSCLAICQSERGLASSQIDQESYSDPCGSVKILYNL